MQVRPAFSLVSDNAGEVAPPYPRTRKAKPGALNFFRDGLRAAAVAGVLSGLPSTVHAVATGRDPLAAARAAGNLLLPATSSGGALLAAGAAAHAALSIGWGTVIAVAVRRTPLAPAVTGLVAGAAIAALDLGLLGRRWPLIRALPVAPQIADHLAFGALAAVAARRG